jgi:hypothetical protein
MEKHEGNGIQPVRGIFAKDIKSLPLPSNLFLFFPATPLTISLSLSNHRLHFQNFRDSKHFFFSFPSNFVFRIPLLRCPASRLNLFTPSRAYCNTTEPPRT